MKIVLLVGALLAATGIYYFDPTTTAWFPKCPLHALTGFSCPGCGSTRALHALFHGRFQTAFAFNPLMVLSLPFLGVLSARRSWLYSTAFPWIVLTIFCVYTVLRNILA